MQKFRKSVQSHPVLRYSMRIGEDISRNRRNYSQSLIVVNVPQRLVLELLFQMANLRIAQPLLLSGPTQNRFKRL